MSVVLRNQAQIQSSLRKKIAGLEKQKSKTPYRIARLIQARARLLAPKESGNLSQSIKTRKLKNGYTVRVTAQGEGGFPYPKWVNQDKGYEVLSYSVPNKRFGIPVGSQLIYGYNPANWGWTGVPGFFTLAVNQTLKNARNIIIKQYNKALGVRVGA